MQKVQTLVTANPRFFKFSVVGTMGAVTDYTILNTLVEIFGFAKGMANTFSFSTAVVQNFFLNRYWTFPESQDRPISSQLVQFTIVNVIGFTINQVVFLSIDRSLQSTWVDLLNNPDWGFTISYNFAKLIATGIVLFWNFGINRIWTYRGL